MASPCSALTRCVVPLSLSFLLHPSLPHLGKSLTDLSDTPLFSSVVRDAGVLGIKAQLSLLADHETTASSCMGPVGLRKEKGKRVLCCGKEFCIQERPGWCLFQRVKCFKGICLKTVTSTHLPVVVALLVLSKSHLILPITSKMGFWTKILLILCNPVLRWLPQIAAFFNFIWCLTSVFQ